MSRSEADRLFRLLLRLPPDAIRKILARAEATQASASRGTEVFRIVSAPGGRL